MSKRPTESEKNTIYFFESFDIKIDKIPDSSPGKSPDFVIKHNGQTIFIEVKEIKENPDEISIRKRFNGDPIGYSSSGGVERIRGDIRKANKKLEVKCKIGQPGILIIQDLRPFITKNTWGLHEEIKDAMFGDRVVWRTVPNHRNGFTAETTADIFTKNKKMRSNEKTIISAVAYLIENEEKKSIAMHLFHNPFADNELKFGLINDERFNEYIISSNSINRSSLTDYGIWEKV